MAEDAARRRFAAASALRELGLLAGLLEPGLAALLDPRVTGQHAPALQLGPESGVDLGERTSDAMTNRGGLSRDATSVNADANVDVSLIPGLHERLLRDRLQVGAGEVFLEGAFVDLDLAVAWPQDDASDRRLPLPGRRVARIAGELGRLGGERRRLVDVTDQLTLAPGALLLLGLLTGTLLGVELSLGLDCDRVELRAGDDLLLLLLALGLGGRGGLLRRCIVGLGRSGGLLGGGRGLLGGSRGLLGGSVVLRGGVLGES